MFSSCEKDDVVYDIGAYKVDLATVQSTNDKQFFLLDSGEKLLNPEKNAKLEFGQRVWLNYSYLEEKVDGYDYVIKVNGVSPITQGRLISVKPITIDTIANDPVYLESVWTSGRYLNISFSFDFKSQPHNISLLMNENQVGNKEITLFFRHNDNNDSLGTRKKSIVSFDLSEILGLPENDKVLSVNINSKNYGEKNYQMEY